MSGVWMSGPAFLYGSREDMPLSREFLVQGFDIPPAEVRKKVSLLATKLTIVGGKLQLIVSQAMEKSWNYGKVQAIVARLLKALITRSRERIREALSPNDLKFARKIMFLVSMTPTEAALKRGDLSSLRVVKSGGIVYTRGRAGPSLEKLLGVSQLPVLMPGTRLAKLIMWESHEEDHRRLPTDALARSRERAWVVRGTAVAKSVTKACPKCRLGNRRQSEQLMADLPLHQTVPCPPFTHVSLDFLGPYLVRGLGNQRARIKVYGLVIVCQNVRAVKLYAVPGYDTYSFLLAYTRFVADHNAPALVVSDRGSQLVKEKWPGRETGRRPQEDHDVCPGDE